MSDNVKRWFVVAANLYENRPGGYIPTKDPRDPLSMVVLASDYDAADRQRAEALKRADHAEAARDCYAMDERTSRNRADRLHATVERVTALQQCRRYGCHDFLQRALQGGRAEAIAEPVAGGCEVSQQWPMFYIRRGLPSSPNQRGMTGFDARGRRGVDSRGGDFYAYAPWDRRKAQRRKA